MFDKKNLNSIVSRLSEISESLNRSFRPEIQALAKELEAGIIEKNPEILSKCRSALVSYNKHNVDVIEVKHVSILIKKMRDEYFPNISMRSIERALDSKYKLESMSRDMPTKSFDFDSIPVEDIVANKEKLKEMIRKVETGPAKDIKVKVSKKSFEDYEWNSPLAFELAKLAVKMEEEYPRQDKELIKKIAKHVRSARDGRFATALQNYEAMIIAANSTKSLDGVCEGEWEFKNRWEIYDDEHSCRDCKTRLLECYAKKCNHICHQVTKPMTTKGLKYAIKTDEWLKQLDEKMKSIYNDSWQGACEFGKVLLRNPEQNKRLTVSDKKKILAAHIRKDGCDQCEEYLEDLNMAD